jgi:hypothetical protein
MRIAGKNIEAPQDEICVLPRGNQTIVFRAKAVLDYSDFDQLCPEPKPTIKTYPDGRQEENDQSPKYKEKRLDWAKKRSDWLIIESLRATEDLEWDTVSYSDPETWSNYQKELQANFTTGEVNQIIGAVMAANSMDDTRFDEAKQHFLEAQQQPLEE